MAVLSKDGEYNRRRILLAVAGEAALDLARELENKHLEVKSLEQLHVSDCCNRFAIVR
jgi:hypothetical protein